MTYDSIIISAPGKIHLLGEHSVVYGYPALLAAVNRRLYVEVRSLKLEVENSNEYIIHSKENTPLVKKAVEVFKKAYSIEKLPPIEINITSQIPLGSGMGSSAALSAALIGALMKFIKNIWNPLKINEMVYKMEKVSHGNPSGADNTTVVFGGLVWFRREFEFLKSVWSLPTASYKIPKFAVIDSGRPEESTKEMVAHIAKNYSQNKKDFEVLFSDQEKQTKKLLLSLREGNSGSLKSAINKGEDNLERMKVVGKKAKKIIGFIKKSEGAGKICGAGGIRGGSGIILCFHDDLRKLKPVENKFKVRLENIILATDGVRIEQNSG